MVLGYRSLVTRHRGMATTKLTIKLLIDKKDNRILFAEAGKEVIDFLFGLLSLPLASVIDLLTKEKMVGSLGNLYESVENLNSNYVQPNLDKDSILKPKSSFIATNIPLLPSNTVEKQPKHYTCTCSYNPKYMTDTSGTVCPTCKHYMRTEILYLAPTGTSVVTPPSGEGGGYVKGVVTYMVMDDLVVTPMSTISSITLLNKFNVNNVGLLEERVVDLTIKEGLDLLRTSLWSRKVLSDVFLGKNGAN